MGSVTKFRFTPKDRVDHVRDVQFKEGKERIFASRVQSLHKCASQDNVDGIMYFINNRKWDVNKLDDFGQTALCLAAHHGSMAAVDELYYFHADLNLESKQKGWTPVHYAANAGYPEIVKKLYDYGANVALPDKAGFTACHLAAQCNQVEVLKTLFFCQPDLPLTNDILMTKTKTGITPTHIAAQFDCFEALRFLARCGCDMEARDELDETPAHKAARNNSQVCLKFLKKRMEVDMHCENKETDTPADLTQMCTRHNQSSNSETGPTQVHSQRMVKLEEKFERSLQFISGSNPDGKRTSYVGTNRFGRTPMEMRLEANKNKGAVQEFRPPKPKGDPPKFQQRHGRLDFKYEG
ncbi:hypothetical protein TrRE_jg11098 [Triparma retinervis]|uniref:Uncharacterized protein n=1 Tax=Triparma retinervis TaxID=2557542 RepID=A0A9W6ZX84_9STRA|nr:hypothetical protein TrRE_jg11098 [Triparma retinervis]